jgi:hypothetical protein
MKYLSPPYKHVKNTNSKKRTSAIIRKSGEISREQYEKN